MKWIALYSQSGYELAMIISTLGDTPDAIFSDRTHAVRNAHVDHLTDVASHNEIMNLLRKEDELCLVTLHGYLRIIPDDITNKHLVINGHPGDVVNQPILKGKDPQARAIRYGLKRTGVTIHRATPTLDSGEVLYYNGCAIKETDDVASLSRKLRKLSIDGWCTVLREYL